MVFAELAQCYGEWERGLKEWKMTDSKVVNGWMEKTDLERTRLMVIRAVQKRFNDSVPRDVISALEMQPSQRMLDEWFDVVLTADSIDEVIAVMRQ